MGTNAFGMLKALIGRTGGTKRVAVAILLILGILGPIAAADPKPGPKDAATTSAIAVEATAITSFDWLNGSTRRFGALEFLGGLTLTSPNRHFGGWSGLTLGRDGRRFLAVSDAGSWMTGELTYRNGRLAGLADTRIGPLVGMGNQALRRSRDRDAEGVRLRSGNLAHGTVLVSFERNHRIGVFDIGPAGLSPPKRYLKRPLEWARLRRNRGIEAVTTIDGGPLKGSVLALAEDMRAPEGHHTGWIWRNDSGMPETLYVRRIGDFDLTDVASLRDGSLVILERSFAWTKGLKVRLRLVRADKVRPGAVLDGPVLLEADLAYDIDNMEGLAVHQRGDETILTLISDDNFNRILQRTIVLQFAIAPDRLAGLIR